MTFDPNWPHGHVTRDGRKARVICADRRGASPASPSVVALIEVTAGREELCLVYGDSGRVYTHDNCPSDLLNAPAPQRTVKVDFFVTAGDGYRSLGDERDRRPQAACIHIVGEIEQGSEITLQIPRSA